MNVHSVSADRTVFLSRWQILKAPGPAWRQQVDEVKADRIIRRMAFRLAQSKVASAKPRGDAATELPSVHSHHSDHW